MDTLFENYETYLNENADDMATPQGAVRLMRDEAAFADFRDGLLEGIDDPVQRSAVSRVLGRQRENILEEAANVGAGAFTHGWSVLSFPILVDIYAEPIISQVMNIYPVSSPTLSIPRVRIHSDIVGYDGNIEASYITPTPHHLIRSNFVNAECGIGHSDLFALSGVDKQGVIMNRRYFMIDSLKIKATPKAGGDPVTFDVSCAFKPDARDTISGTSAVREFVGPAGTADADKKSSIQCSINIDFNTGTITNQATITPAEDATYDYEYAGCNARLKFTAKNSDKGRVIVSIQNEMQDVNIDPNEDFMINLTTEEIQDYRSIFKIDLARTLSEAVKRQVLLNKDFDLAYFLHAAESDIADNNNMYSVNLNAYNSAANAYTPNNVYDVMKGLIPYISSAISGVYKSFQMYPEFLLCGIKLATLLRAMQQYMVSMSSQSGSLGWSGETAQFLKLKILESYSIDANGCGDKMYLTTKAPDSELEKSTLIDLVYNPLYITSEITNGMQKNYCRTRTLVNVNRTDGLAVIKVSGTENIIGR